MTDAPELPAELFAQLWGEALQRHPDASVHPGPAGAELARLAYAAGWEARAAEDSSVVGAALCERAAELLLASPPAEEEVTELVELVAVAGEPSDEKLLQTYGAAKRDYIYEGDVDDWPRKEERAATVAGLRAVIAADRAGRPAPADEEVGELVAWLTEQAVRAADCKRPMAAGMLTWAAEVAGEHADLLEQRQAAPVPVAVSERLPGVEDCDAEGCCWAWRGFDPDNEDDGEFWQLIHAERLTAQLGGGWSHWLPAHALPLPSGEAADG